MSCSRRARSASVTRGIKSRTAITSSASRTWYASISSCGVSDRTSARRRGRIVISPSADRRPMASLMRATAYRQFLGQRHLGQLGAGQEVISQDLVAQMLVDPLRQRQIVERYRH